MGGRGPETGTEVPTTNARLPVRRGGGYIDKRKALMKSTDRAPILMASGAPKRRLQVGGVLLLGLVFVVIGLYAAPNPPTSPQFRSGGLGLTKAAWDRQHTVTHNTAYAPDLFAGIEFYDQDIAVTFWPEGWLNLAEARITSIQSGLLSGPAPDTARTASRELLPADAQLQQTMSDPTAPGTLIAVYHSASLATRYPPRVWAPDAWEGFLPGTFYIRYSSSFVIGIPSEMHNLLNALSKGTLTPTNPRP